MFYYILPIPQYLKLLSEAVHLYIDMLGGHILAPVV